jgi:tRNA pseudouridine55 synthase
MEQTTVRKTNAQQADDGQLLLIDKPKGWTSFDVVHKIRHLLHVRKVGHAGTLDPMATGLLIVCTGRRTKELGQFIGLDKEYQVEMTLGGRTESFDAETPVVEERDLSGLTEETIEKALRSFVGPLTQVPPMWSAAKVRGKALYRYARKGQVVERTPREVVIRVIREITFDLPRVRFVLSCSKGTYVRSLVDTVGSALGCGAYVSGLRRTRIGSYGVADALTIDAVPSRAVPSHDVRQGA